MMTLKKMKTAILNATTIPKRTKGYKPITTSLEDNLNLRADGEINNGEISIEKEKTELKTQTPIKRPKQESKPPD